MKTIRQYIDKAGEKVAEYNEACRVAEQAYNHICIAHNTGEGMTEALEEENQARDAKAKAFRSAVYHVKNIYLVLGLDIPEMYRPHQLREALRYVALTFRESQRRMNEFCNNMNR